jgi:carbon-monoxide dehydrogenase small subunit
MSRKTIQLTVNGAAVAATVEPRLQLADFLREHLTLTGTHIGCEHGVCGACTIEIDGAPARSCIAYAAACDGADVRTIEGFGDDPVMAALREAFSTHHALQCGYCTPGMLVTARDIVLRLPDADEARIRKELAGNLCRCTGYVGIVRAIQSVLSKRSAGHARFDSAAPDTGRTETDTAPTVAALRSGHMDAGTADSAAPMPSMPDRVRAERNGVTSKQERADRTHKEATARPQTTLRQSFTVDHPRDKVWAFFGRLGEVTLCLPGASVVGTPTEDHIDMRIRVKVGPIVAEFEGAADAVRDASRYEGRISGGARDARSSSTTRGEIRYVLSEEKGGTATRADVDVGFTLTGPLAQFSRSSIVQDIARRMTAAFAQNLQARLEAPASAAGDHAGARAPAHELNATSLVFSVLWERIRSALRAVFRR